MSVMDRRAAAIAETVARVRGVEAELGVTAASLAEIKRLVIDLAQRSFSASCWAEGDCEGEVVSAPSGRPR